MLNKYLPGFLLAIAVTGLISCGGNKEQQKETNEKPVAVTLSTTSAGVQNAILASGQVEAVQTANISTRVMGRITNIYVKAGDKVNKGQLLATISDEDIRAKRAQTDAMIAEAEAAYANAQKDYDRFNNLYKQQSATAKELDNVTLQYNSAKARVDAAKQMRSEVNASLSYSSLTAPFSGVVTQKLAEVGSIANPGMPIVTIEQSGILQVSASIAESDISNIHLGDAATLLIKSTGKNFEGKVIQLNPSSQFTGGQYIVKISIPESAKKDIYSGMFVSVTIPLKEAKETNPNVILVPASAIVNRDELTGIYTVSENKTALLRWIRLGKNYGDKVEVISGLANNEQFILSAEGKLYNGAPVVVK
ncbi:MAG: efflux RND transporter periplasmic adaptor subunit [Sphingobacteriales bacterium]|nr:efflux RND transporter periplasmic adaptor subunit [Sphingobacteriales bacterium]MBI3719102.1 efflux RND transporter periplasmic adaptor subunit [Sphingobacteriales bacterium]